MHAYWAANFWTPYAIADKIFSIFSRKSGFFTYEKKASMTGGLVQEDSFAILPTPTPLVTFLITLICMMVCFKK